ncbi:MAG: O-antigen ligase family protein [Sulfurovum sp.]|nr:O-antigen ligase family protein [Sulfurovum sp.]
MTLAKLPITSYINFIVIMYAFILPISRAGIVFFSLLLILLWLFEAGFQAKYRLLSQNKVILALLGFLLFNILSLLWSNNVGDAYHYIVKYWYFLPMIVLFTSVQKASIPKILSAFIAGMFVSEMLSYGVFFEVWEFKHATAENPSPFMHHIEYSIFLAFTALIILGRIFNHKEVKYQLLYSLFFMSIIGNLFLTAGRTGQIAFLVGIFVLAFISFQNKFKAFVVFVLLSSFISFIAFNFSSTFHQRILAAKTNILHAIEDQKYCSSLGARIGACIVVGDMILSDPLLGVGIIDNMEVFHAKIDKDYPQMQCLHLSFMHLHNQFWQITTQLGLVGLFLFLMLFYRIFTLNIREHRV